MQREEKFRVEITKALALAATYNHESSAKLLHLFELKCIIVVVAATAAAAVYKILKIVLRSKHVSKESIR